MTQTYLYWTSTTLLSLLYLTSAAMYLLKTKWVKEQFSDLGYPTYLVIPLVFYKIIAVSVILLNFNAQLTDFVYAAMICHLLLAAGAHFGIKKVKDAVPAIIGLLLALVSYTTQYSARYPI